MKKLYLIIFMVLLLASCSFRENEEVHEKAVLPDIILEGAEYTLGQDGNSPIYINSSRMTLYSRDNRAIVENMEFVSYNDDAKRRILYRRLLRHNRYDVALFAAF